MIFAWSKTFGALYTKLSELDAIFDILDGLSKAGTTEVMVGVTGPL